MPPAFKAGRRGGRAPAWETSAAGTFPVPLGVVWRAVSPHQPQRSAQPCLDLRRDDFGTATVYDGKQLRRCRFCWRLEAR